MLTRSAALLFATLVGSTTLGKEAPAGPPPAPSKSVAASVADLDNADPAIRAVATKDLIADGPAVRPLLRRALPTARPEAADRIRFILMHVPWVFDSDPDMVKQAMVGYADADADYRRAVIDERFAGVESGTKGPLLRIVLQDTCSAVRWEAASVLAQLLDEPTDPISVQLDAQLTRHPKAEEAYPTPSDNAALLALAGYACRDRNPDQARRWMEQAVAVESAEPTATVGQMDFALRWLADEALTARQYSRLIQLVREQADRSICTTAALPEPVANLFAFHADFGPFPGVEQDLHNYVGYFWHPELIYAAGRWLQRQEHPLAAAAVNGFAFADGGFSLESHFAAGVFCLEHEWFDQADRELGTCLHLPGGQSFGVYYQLYRLASQRNDDLEAARSLETGLTKLSPENAQAFNGRPGKPAAWTPDDGWGQVHWHYLRAARDAHDSAGAESHLAKLLELDRDVHVLRRDPGMAADIVPALQDLKRDREADQIFADAYNALATEVAAAPGKAMPKNNLAWLCACSGRHLDEAVRLADEAVAQLPEDAACLDTQAEAYFRNGKLARAVEIESHAVRIKPTDLYMQKQLQKYQFAATPQH